MSRVHVKVSLKASASDDVASSLHRLNQFAVSLVPGGCICLPIYPLPVRLPIDFSLPPLFFTSCDLALAVSNCATRASAGAFELNPFQFTL